jgi:uncharacterized membrane protein YgcG
VITVLIILAVIWAWVLIPPAIRQARRKGVEAEAVPTEPPEHPPRIQNRTFRWVVAYLGLVDDPRHDGGVRAFGGFGGGGCGGGGTGCSGGGGC